MADSSKRQKDIFLKALDLSTPAERAGFLAEACSDDEALRREVEAMLQAHARSDSFLEKPAAVMAPTIDEPPIAERPGTIIGSYKLMEQLGEGGFGLVFVAEQQQPVRRKVALKIIKPGMDTRDVIARFEAERQALALMDHPNIAKVLDAGATESGRPYFVMELVKGIPVTDYCDQNELTPRERLALFMDVCNAVQHAHQKGIIHRDVKPSNILVTSHDGKPVVKVIDFGIAKAIGQQLTEKTIYTRFAQMIGTPLYMSPEQAEMSGLDIDTRSDIYSLGVLLYELLTGTTPFDSERLKKAAFDEIRRIIREEEPPRPSTRLSTLGATLSAVSARRKTEPAKLSALVRGDLDWIVMKSLEKDRDRRYETASGLAKDIERYLMDEAVEACPPSPGYRLKKFARRNKKILVTAAAFAALLVLGVVVSTWQAVRATMAERDALVARDAKEQARREAVDNELKARAAEAAERAAKQKALLAADAEKNAKQSEAAQRELAEEAANLLVSFLNELDLDKAPGNLTGRLTRRHLDGLAANVAKKYPNEPEQRARLRLTLGRLHSRLGEYDRAVNLYEEALKDYRPYLDVIIDHSTPVAIQHHCGRAAATAGLLTWAYQDAGQVVKTISLYEELYKKRKKDLGPDNRHTLAAGIPVGMLYLQDGHCDRAEPLLAKGQAIFGFKAYTDWLQKVKPAADQYQQALAAKGADHLDTLAARLVFARAWRDMKQMPSAAAYHFQKILAARQRLLGAGHPDTLVCQMELGVTRLEQGAYTVAEPLLVQSYEGLEMNAVRNQAAYAPGSNRHKQLREAAERLVQLYDAWGKPEKAAQWQKELKKM